MQSLQKQQEKDDLEFKSKYNKTDLRHRPKQVQKVSIPGFPESYGKLHNEVIDEGSRISNIDNQINKTNSEIQRIESEIERLKRGAHGTDDFRKEMSVAWCFNRFRRYSSRRQAMLMASTIREDGITN